MGEGPRGGSGGRGSCERESRVAKGTRRVREEQARKRGTLLAHLKLAGLLAISKPLQLSISNTCKTPFCFQSLSKTQSRTVSPGRGETHLRMIRAERRVWRRVEDPVGRGEIVRWRARGKEGEARKKGRGNEKGGGMKARGELSRRRRERETRGERRTVRTRHTQTPLPLGDGTKCDPGGGELRRGRETVGGDEERGGVGNGE